MDSDLFSMSVESPAMSADTSHRKGRRSSKSFTRDGGVTKRRRQAPSRRPISASPVDPRPEDIIMADGPESPVITLVVGKEQRLFAAHHHILCRSPFFGNTLRGMHLGSPAPRISLPDEEPEILSSVLEYLYKGDYYPRLVHDQRRDSWELGYRAGDRAAAESLVYHRGLDEHLLKDTAVYCAAAKYGLDELKRLALRKQGLRSGIQCSTILSSARYAYANTPDTDSKLRAHYLALIIRARRTFKRSGTMQLEMFNGGTQLFFDLFVALCNHVDDISEDPYLP